MNLTDNQCIRIAKELLGYETTRTATGEILYKTQGMGATKLSQPHQDGFLWPVCEKLEEKKYHFSINSFDKWIWRLSKPWADEFSPSRYNNKKDAVLAAAIDYLRRKDESQS